MYAFWTHSINLGVLICECDVGLYSNFILFSLNTTLFDQQDTLNRSLK